MFYDFLEIKDKYSDWKDDDSHSHLVITSSFDNHMSLTSYQLVLLVVKWKQKIKEQIMLEDEACVVNTGNIFVRLPKTRKQEFIDSISDIFIEKDKKCGIYTKILELQPQEMYYLMQP